MNETECEKLIESIVWTEPSSLISLAILEFINVLVIGGNCLVIAAVFCSNKLRSVTNFFIVNLAVADLLVGLLVLPFSATWEVFKVRILIIHHDYMKLLYPLNHPSMSLSYLLEVSDTN